MATILVCDDEPALRELMRAAIGGPNRFVEAESGDEALEAARFLRPDVVLLDVMLPVIDGLDVLRQLRADPGLASVPVVVVSAWDTEADRLAAEEAGADAFVAKPFLPEQLEALVRGFLESER